MEKILEVLEAYIQGRVEQRAIVILEEEFKETKISVVGLLKNSYTNIGVAFRAQGRYEIILEEEKRKMLDQIMVKLGL